MDPIEEYNEIRERVNSTTSPRYTEDHRRMKEIEETIVEIERLKSRTVVNVFIEKRKRSSIDDNDATKVTIDSLFCVDDVTMLIFIHLGPMELYMVTRVSEWMRSIVARLYSVLADVFMSRMVIEPSFSAAFDLDRARIISLTLAKSKSYHIESLISIVYHLWISYREYGYLKVERIIAPSRLSRVMVHNKVTDLCKPLLDYELFCADFYCDVKRDVTDRFLRTYHFYPYYSSSSSEPFFYFNANDMAAIRCTPHNNEKLAPYGPQFIIVDNDCIYNYQYLGLCDSNYMLYQNARTSHIGHLLDYYEWRLVINQKQPHYKSRYTEFSSLIDVLCK